VAYSFNEGFLDEIYTADPVWVTLDEADDKIRGSFDVALWWGSFKAEPCDGSWGSTYGYGYYPYPSY
jgi:hypothetical protein